MYNLSHCPDCNARWQDELNIYERFLQLKKEGDPYWATKTDEQIREAANSYGWHAKGEIYNEVSFRAKQKIGTEETENVRFSKIVGIENPAIYDGVSFWQCPVCETKWDRFTNEKTLRRI